MADSSTAPAAAVNPTVEAVSTVRAATKKPTKKWRLVTGKTPRAPKATKKDSQFPRLPGTTSSRHPSSFVPKIFVAEVESKPVPLQAAGNYAAAAAAAVPLAPLGMKQIPPAVARAVGLQAEHMPLLPKKHPELYEVDCFVTQLKYDYDDLRTMEVSEDPFRCAAMRRAQRIVLVRRQFGRPWMFLHGVGRATLATPLEMRTTIVDADPQVGRVVAPPTGFVFEPSTHSDEPHVLQGTMADLHDWADHVQVRYMIGKHADQPYYEAFGIPKVGWQDHLLGTPISLITAGAAAPIRATARLPMAPSAPYRQRFEAAGALRTVTATPLAYVLLNGLDVRLFAAGPFTIELKQALLQTRTTVSVYTDIKTRPVPPKIGGADTAVAVEAAGLTVNIATEVAIFGHSRVCLSAAHWEQLLQLDCLQGARLIKAGSIDAVFAVPRQRAALADGTNVGERVLLSSEFLG